MALTSANSRSVDGADFSLNVRTLSISGTIEVNAIFSAIKASTATSLTALNIAGIAPPISPQWRANATAGNLCESIGSKLQLCGALQSMAGVAFDKR